ncbi:hypothetical protein [Sphingobacterium hungaricum]|uniref:Uncharacterized protein n=1 Tax=Sphingobacterium hungaricum TaxID=2082723 RepID=A0A928V0E5_9SPHI|nr:hypothetical protein [Sphingobacterium hungaricum]MBE8714666.1 hypothetical protein [Sphingobacterium hungaricum]
MVVNLDDLNSLTDYVAKGRKEIILLAGFNPSKEENSSLPPVQEITGLTVNYTTALGIFKIGVKRQEQAYEYIFKWVFENPVDLVEVVWNEYTSHKANFEVNVGRTSGTIWFMVELRDKEGDVAQTPIYSKVIAKLGL